MLPGIRWGSLRQKVIAWSFIPTTIILVAVALVTLLAYQQVTEDLVIERDRELTRLSAGQLASELTRYTGDLTSLGRTADLTGNEPAAQREALQRARNRLVVFDGGVLVLNTFGVVAAAQPERPEILGQDWSDRAYFRQLVRARGPIFSDILPDGPEGAEVISLAVPIIGSQGEFVGALVGMFRLDARTVSAFYGSIVKQRIGGNNTKYYLVDGNSRVIFHSDPERIGEELTGRPVVEQVLDGKTGAIRTTDLDNRAIVAGFAPVPGTHWGLVTEENWAALISPSRGYSLFLLFLLGLGIIIPALVVTLGVKRILQPIEQLIEAAQEVAAGNFNYTITAPTGDEIEELARQFNRMAAQLQESYTHLEQRVVDRTRELAILNAIGATVNASLDLAETLDRALDETMDLLNLEVGEIRLLDEASGALVTRTQRGLSPEFVRRIDRQQVSEVLPEASVLSGEPVIEPDVMTSTQYLPAQEEGIRALALFPLRAKERLLGLLCLATRRGPRWFTRPERELLRAISDQVSVAIENAQLYERAQKLAVLEERQRLARDLHDSVTQSLYGVTMYAEAAARLVSSGEAEQAADYLRELRGTAQEALREMRLLIFELRPSILQQEGLPAALQARLESVERRSGLDTVFNVEGDGPLPPKVEEQLYWIAQEALNNALKHAQARRVVVNLCHNADWVTMEVADDGRGFEAATARTRGGFGLPGMEERAAQLNGHLVIDSQAGQGTRVRVEVNLRDTKAWGGF